jgi:predicted amidohydrolase
MSESKVVIHAVFPTHLLSPDLPYTNLVNVVTHADYEALERTMVGYRNMWDASEKELASLKARVMELVEAEKAYRDSDALHWGDLK